MNSNISKNVKVTRVMNAVAAGQTEQSGTILDMATWDGVMFLALFGAVTDASVVTLKAQQNTLNQAGGMADIAGSSASITAATSSNGALITDVFRPQQQFVRADITRTAQNAAIDGVIAIQYKGSKAPTVHDATTILASALAAF